MRELLGEQAAERDAEHVDPVVSEGVQQPLHGAGQPAHPARQGVPAGAADPGCVHGDGAHRPGVERVLERSPHLQVGADAHQQQQRPAGTPQPDP